MKLYAFPVAPNPTKVRLYLAEKAELGALSPVEKVHADLARFGGFDVIRDFVHVRRWDEAYRSRPAARAVVSV